MHRRDFIRTASIGATVLGLRVARSRTVDAAPPLPRPSRAQLAWQQDELGMFIHFGVNTFTDREWGEGTEDPRLFDPSAFDARQWARTARAAGFRAMILTAKHHDGFCLWPTHTTAHSVASSPWRGGHGDVVREFVNACRAEGLKPGLYLSPWDRHEPRYGDSPRYNDFYLAQLTELLTQYGTIHEVWFDGANGEGPSGRRQEYDWPRTWNTVRRLQPDAVMFSDAGPDVRWIGNERGSAGTTNWSTVRPAIVTVPGMSGDDVMRSLQDGDRDGTVWRHGRFEPACNAHRARRAVRQRLLDRRETPLHCHGRTQCRARRDTSERIDGDADRRARRHPARTTCSGVQSVRAQRDRVARTRARNDHRSPAACTRTVHAVQSSASRDQRCGGRTGQRIDALLFRRVICIVANRSPVRVCDETRSTCNGR